MPPIENGVRILMGLIGGAIFVGFVLGNGYGAWRMLSLMFEKGFGWHLLWTVSLLSLFAAVFFLFAYLLFITIAEWIKEKKWKQIFRSLTGKGSPPD
ncbi:MAG: hypothetical protein O7A62_13470 [Alphaproteobacteria bacterium]|nr:hypothetical protein [Alphaproteobacteria bacterium]